MRKQPRFLLRNLKQLQTLLRPCFENHTDNAQMLASLCSFLREAIAALSATAEQEGQEVMNELMLFMRWLSETIGQGLLVQPEQKVHGSLQLLQALVSQRPEMLAQHLMTLSKLMQRFTKDHALRRVEPTPAPSAAAAAAGGETAEAVALQALKLTIQLMAPSVLEMGEQRKIFYSALVMLIERSTDADLLQLIVKVVSNWLLAPLGPPPALSPKERANLLLKMVQLDQVPSAAP